MTRNSPLSTGPTGSGSTLWGWLGEKRIDNHRPSHIATRDGDGATKIEIAIRSRQSQRQQDVLPAKPPPLFPCSPPSPRPNDESGRARRVGAHSQTTQVQPETRESRMIQSNQQRYSAAAAEQAGSAHTIQAPAFPIPSWGEGLVYSLRRCWDQ